MEESRAERARDFLLPMVGVAGLVLLLIGEFVLPPKPEPVDVGPLALPVPAVRGVYPVEVDRVVDGDTIQVDVHLGMDFWLVNQRVRLAGIDCPEMNTAEGKAAAAFAAEWLADRKCELTDRGKDKYGRLLGEIRAAENGETLNSTLIQAGHAKVY
jgi:endonuclease YncB( thermonuclease family)